MPATGQADAKALILIKADKGGWEDVTEALSGYCTGVRWQYLEAQSG
jgi:hypothetical protein